VAEEVAWIRERYDPDQLWYADDVFTIAHRWFLQFAAELKKRRLHLPFECISRADRLNEEIIGALAEMGCHRLWIGSESGSQRILDAMQRKARVEDIQEKTKLLQRQGIEVGMFIMLGYEGEEPADIAATVEHLKQADPDVFLTTVAYPIKGTKYYDAVAERITAELPWRERTDRDLAVSGRYSRRFYDHATRWIVNEVKLHQARRTGSRNVLKMAKMFLNARRGRLGMSVAQRGRETAQIGSGGRGWADEERARDAW
jgi:radical SAM superfamily enzyme YgiQ (UPF0313 family)